MADALPRIDAYVGRELDFGRLGAFGLRMKVWWSRDRLTRALARGVDSTASRELALRAGQITARETRQVAASAIEDLLDEVRNAAPVLSSRVPVDRGKLESARGELLGLTQRLRSTEPARSQGMALVLLLLSDVERPLYGVGAAEDLQEAIMQASQLLDARPAGDGARA